MSTVGTKPTLLVLDTSSPTAAVALVQRGERRGTYLTGSHHGQTLLAVVANALASAQLKIAQLDAIAVVQGPGSLTGIRLGCTAAQAMAWEAQLPLIPLNGLVALAWETMQRGDGLVVRDARMQHLYITRFTRGSWQAAEMSTRHIPVTELEQWLRPQAPGVPAYPYCGREDTLAQLRGLDTDKDLAECFVPVKVQWQQLADYAVAKWHAGAALISPQALLPNYCAEWKKS